MATVRIEIIEPTGITVSSYSSPEPGQLQAVVEESGTLKGALETATRRAKAIVDAYEETR